jgi:hypothetical protein
MCLTQSQLLGEIYFSVLDERLQAGDVLFSDMSAEELQAYRDWLRLR